jgi:hypothetical protein
LMELQVMFDNMQFSILPPEVLLICHFSKI